MEEIVLIYVSLLYSCDIEEELKNLAIFLAITPSKMLEIGTCANIG
jgi:hypothetical protein